MFLPNNTEYNNNIFILFVFVLIKNNTHYHYNTTNKKTTNACLARDQTRAFPANSFQVIAQTPRSAPEIRIRVIIKHNLNVRLVRVRALLVVH